MSTDMPYVVRVYFDNGRGCVRMHGFRRALEIAPAIEGLPPYIMLDYIPASVAMIQPKFEKVRDLWKAERESVEQWLATVKGLW
jgi:hypothetical protein